MEGAKVDWSELRLTIARYALIAARAHQNGHAQVKLGDCHPQALDLATGGYCARFVRQIVECALGLLPMSWEYRRANARLMERGLRDAGLYVGRTLDDAAPGDIVGINKPPWVAVGHIAIYVGEVEGIPTIAENTSVAGRGKPRVQGTKLTPWSAVATRVTGIYRLG